MKSLTKSWMETEIFEQPEIVALIFKKYVKGDEILIDFPNSYKKIKFIASGSSYNCARMAEKFFRDIASLDTNCEFSSEFLANKNQKIDKKTLYFFVSQSGETADTLAVLDLAKKGGAKVFALTNCEKSTMHKKADYKISVLAGEENSVAATKSFSACVLCAWLCAVKLSDNHKKYLKTISSLQNNLSDVLKNVKQIEKCANFLSKHKSFPLIGYNYYYILAKEGALKIKETSYIDANAYALGEFIHGHIALLNQKNAVVEIFTSDLGEFELRNLKKIKDKYRPKIVAITDVKENVDTDYSITFQKTESDLTKFLIITLILQLLALKIACKLRRNVDKPKGLNKVVI